MMRHLVSMLRSPLRANIILHGSARNCTWRRYGAAHAPSRDGAREQRRTRGEVKGEPVAPVSEVVKQNVLRMSKGASRSFDPLPLSPELQRAVEEMKLHRPTEIQSLAIPRLVRGESINIGAPTGSGKTLAFVLPVFERLRNLEQNASEDASAAEKRPRAIVITPNRELSLQVMKVAKQLTHHAPLRVRSIVGGAGKGKQSKRVGEGVDVLICTPGSMWRLKQEGRVFLSKLSVVVMDEVDVLMGKGFETEMADLLDALKVITSSATIRSTILKKISNYFPGTKDVSARHTNETHSLTHMFYRIRKPLGNDKIATLLALLRKLQDTSVMIFCGKLSSCRAVDHALHDEGIRPYCLHGGIPSNLRTKNWKEFNAQEKGVLVCTDIASRGLDTKQVDVVINFDFPVTGVDYVHRCGRAGRVRAGQVHNLVMHKEVAISQEIIRALKAGNSLEGIAEFKAR